MGFNAIAASAQKADCQDRVPGDEATSGAEGAVDTDLR